MVKVDELTTWNDHEEETTPISYLFMISCEGGLVSKLVLLPFRLIIIAVILLGNATTIVAIRKFSRLQTNTNWILCSLGVSDIWVGCTTFMVVVRCMLMPDLTCSNLHIQELLHLLEMIPVSVSLAHLVAVAADRYVAIIWPLHYEQYVTDEALKRLIISAWIPGIFTISSYGWWYINWDSTSCQSPVPAFYDVVIKCGFQLMMTFVLLVLYVRIFMVSRQQRRNIHSMEVQNAEKEQQNKRKIREYKATLLTLVVSVMAFILWTPMFVSMGCIYLGLTTPLTFTMLQISVGFGIFNSAVNFFIYAFMNTELRNAFAKIWGFKSQHADVD